ncbi:MAG TPA: FG-GAP repeat protein [Terriglobales bacterium]|nr:FG-GAP repeat protein [Terriglobales bacterium]
MKRARILLAVLVCGSACSVAQTASSEPSTSGWANLPPAARASISSALARDPAIRIAQLTASDGEEFDTLGWNVAISGNTVAVGAPGATIGANSAQGAVYIFVKPASGWANMTQTAKLTASDGQADSLLGRGIAISGNTVVAGAPGQFGNQFGEAYVFLKPASGWTNMNETARLTPSDAVPGDTFGYSVGISGNTVVVGALGALNLQGAAYVFVKPAGGWIDMTQTGELTASDGASGDEFASTVAISGNTIVGGSFLDNGAVGAAYVFAKPANGWANGTQTAKLTPSDGKTDALGLSVAISGNTVVAGAFGWPGNESFQGAAYVFVEPSGGWANMTQTAILTASDGAAQDQLGYSVAISGSIIAVGAEGWPDGGNEGAIYAYVKPTTGWSNKTETVKLTVSGGAQELGYAAALSGTTGVGGAPNAAVNSHQDQGIAYVFTEQ